MTTHVLPAGAYCAIRVPAEEPAGHEIVSWALLRTLRELALATDVSLDAIAFGGSIALRIALDENSTFDRPNVRGYKAAANKAAQALAVAQVAPDTPQPEIVDPEGAMAVPDGAEAKA